MVKKAYSLETKLACIEMKKSGALHPINETQEKHSCRILVK